MNCNAILPVWQINVWLIIHTYKISATQQPTYLHNTLLTYWPGCNLHSSEQQLLQMSYVNTEFGQRSFSYCSLKIWNEIHVTVKAFATVATFKFWLKSQFLTQLVTHCPPVDCLQLWFEISQQRVHYILSQCVSAASASPLILSPPASLWSIGSTTIKRTTTSI